MFYYFRRAQIEAKSVRRIHLLLFPLLRLACLMLMATESLEKMASAVIYQILSGNANKSDKMELNTLITIFSLPSAHR